MNFAMWLPLLTSLGILTLAGFMLLLAALDSRIPSLAHRLRSRGARRGR